jgi:hypothetical protein
VLESGPHEGKRDTEALRAGVLSFVVRFQSGLKTSPVCVSEADNPRAKKRSRVFWRAG